MQWLDNRLHRSVGEMRIATWRIIGENVIKLVGKVYRSDTGMPPCL